MNEKWISNLNDETCYDIIPILQEIFNEFNPMSEESTNFLIASLMQLINSTERSFQRFEYELSYKVYYKILTKSKITKDALIYSNFKIISSKYKPFILNAILFTDFHNNLNYVELYEMCLQVFQDEIKENSKNLVIIIKALNLCCKKYQKYIIEIKLEDIYMCLQNGIRNETLILFEHCLQSNKKLANYLKNIIQNWSWTNRNKYYLLSSIVKLSKIGCLEKILNLKVFFDGIRTSLNLKNLFSAGQNLVKVLSKNQDTKKEFNKFIIDLLCYGTHTELENLLSQWMRHIDIEELYMEYMKKFDEKKNENILLEDKLRFVIICNIFQSEVIKDEIIVNKLFVILVKLSFNETDSKINLYVYLFVVNSLNNLCSTDTLDYLIYFYKKFLILPNADFRQTILSKFPQILNFLSKRFQPNNPIEKSVIEFFIKNLIEIIKIGISDCCEYQKLIFSSKLYKSMLKFVNINTNLSNKNYKIKGYKNNNFVKYLREIINFEIIKHEIFNMFEFIEFDDIRELYIEILLELHFNEVDMAFEQAKIKSSSEIVDVSNLSSSYLKIAINSVQHENECNNLNVRNDNYAFLQNECTEYFTVRLNNILENFESDPFWSCKTGQHLFGNLDCLAELYKIKNFIQNYKEFSQLVDMLDNIVELILKLLNIAAATNEISETSASFELMDESLQALLEKSKLKSINYYEDRKLLLLSFWTTLKACCTFATIIGTKLLNYPEEDKTVILFQKCLYIHFKVLQRCRHKGAIEAAGLSLGKLIKTTTTQQSTKSRLYQKLFSCFAVLFGSINKISTTRRGAGLAIMLHHILKNDFQNGKPLFHHSIKTLLSYTQKTETPMEDIVNNLSQSIHNDQNENFDAMVLHYLCVIVKDTELRDMVSEYYDEIMMTAIKRIQHRDWKVRNAALQLFGGLVPKIVGQKQASSDFVKDWEPTNTNFNEIQIKLSSTCLYILEYCQKINEKINSTGIILLFLQFFSNIEYIKLSDNVSQFVLNFRKIYWKFLSHKCEKVRKLSAICIIRSHDYNYELPLLLFRCVEIYFQISNPNFEQGLLFTIIEGIYKLKSEKTNDIDEFLKVLREHFIYFYCKKNLNIYQKLDLLNFFMQAQFNLESEFVNEFFGKFEINNFIADNYCNRDIFTYKRLK